MFFVSLFVIHWAGHLFGPLLPSFVCLCNSYEPHSKLSWVDSFSCLVLDIFYLFPFCYFNVAFCLISKRFFWLFLLFWIFILTNIFLVSIDFWWLSTSPFSASFHDISCDACRVSSQPLHPCRAPDQPLAIFYLTVL